MNGEKQHWELQANLKYSKIYAPDEDEVDESEKNEDMDIDVDLNVSRNREYGYYNDDESKGPTNPIKTMKSSERSNRPKKTHRMATRNRIASE